MSRQTSLELIDKREHQIKQASEIVARSLNDYAPMNVVIDAALAHLLKSEKNIQDARDKYDPETIQDICNASVFIFRYRTAIESNWR